MSATISSSSWLMERERNVGFADGGRWQRSGGSWVDFRARCECSVNGAGQWVNANQGVQVASRTGANWSIPLRHRQSCFRLHCLHRVRRRTRHERSVRRKSRQQTARFTSSFPPLALREPHHHPNLPTSNRFSFWFCVIKIRQRFPLCGLIVMMTLAYFYTGCYKVGHVGKLSCNAPIFKINKLKGDANARQMDQ